jgi:hypothetical protein
MLNFCYDVPVKLFSSHLLAMSVFLLLPDLGRLANLFVFNRPVEPVDLRPLFGRPWLNRATLIFRTLVVLAWTGGFLFFSYQARFQFAPGSRSPLYGVWNVEEFEADGEARPPLVTDALRWRRVVFDYPGRMVIEPMGKSGQGYRVTLNADEHRLTLKKRDDATWQATLAYEQSEEGLLALEGTFDDRKVRVRLRLADANTFLLVTRGFHWVNEVPFNR